MSSSMLDLQPINAVIKQGEKGAKFLMLNKPV